MFHINCTEDREYIIKTLTDYLSSQFLTDHLVGISNLDYGIHGCIEVFEILKNHTVKYLELKGLIVGDTITNYELIQLILLLVSVETTSYEITEDIFSQREVLSPLETFIRLAEEVKTMTYDVNGLRYNIEEIDLDFIVFLDSLVKRPIIEAPEFNLLDKLLTVNSMFTNDLMEVYLYIVESNTVDIEYLTSLRCIEDFDLSNESILKLNEILKVIIKEDDE